MLWTDISREIKMKLLVENAKAIDSKGVKNQDICQLSGSVNFQSYFLPNRGI